MKVYGYQLGYVESTRYAVFNFRPPHPVPDVETAIEQLVGLILPLLPKTSVDDDDVVSALFHLTRGGYDSDRSWDAKVTFDPSELRDRAENEGWVFGELFADEVLQGVNVWITRGWGCVYMGSNDSSGRTPRPFVMPSLPSEV